jgi:AcrR family transcriptional regulator
MARARTYTQVRRAAAQDRTRTALLDAAEDAFFSRPWDEVSLEAIAAAAGSTKQTLLRHFGSKDGLLEQAYERAFERVREQRLAAPTDDIAGAVDNLLDHYEQSGERAIKIAAMPGGGRIGEIGRRSRQLHYDWVEHAFGRRLDRAGPTERARLHAALIVACDVQSWWILSRDLRLDRPEVRATLILTIRRLLGEDA